MLNSKKYNKHNYFLKKALKLAFSNKGSCAPNPAVGAILVKDNQIIAQGSHFGCGTPHAEALAIRNASPNTKDSTLYVTLEPCCHFGRTPPCTNLIIKQGIKEVYFAQFDPNPIVSGKGQKKLLQSDIKTTHLPFQPITDFYKSYAYWQKTKMPWVTTKLALSQDDCIAGPDGTPVQITGKECQIYTHKHRYHSDAILTTARTINRDNPRFDTRCYMTDCKKPLYIIDSNLQLKKDAHIFQTCHPVTIFHSSKIKNSFNFPKVNLIPVISGNNFLDLNDIIRIIGSHGVHDLWIEAGGTLFKSVISQKLAHNAILYKSLKILGNKALKAFHSDFNITSFDYKNTSNKNLGNDTVERFEIDKVHIK